MSGLKMNGPVSVRCLVWFRQKTADEVRISDWSSDVCSSDLLELQKFTELRLDRRHGQHQVLDTYAPTPRSIKPRFVRRNHPRFQDRQSVVAGKSVLVRVDLGGRRSLK